MKVTIMASLFAERNMDVDAGQMFFFCKINSNTNYNSILAETKTKTFMKKISILLLTLSLALSSCSSSSDGGDGGGGSSYAMTAKINGETFEANNPFGTNAFSTTNIWSYYPLEDYVMLQGRAGGVLGMPEINLWLKKTDIVVGTTTLAPETFDTPPSHYIDLIDNRTDETEKTKSGTIVITEVNTSTKIVKGTFQFTSTDGDQTNPASIINATVTDGTFRYKYAD
jgi:hypothetical protein